MNVRLEDVAALNRLIHGYKISRMIGLATDLGIADQISATGAVSASVLATDCGVLVDPLLRLCRTLASFGIFTVNAEHMVGHSRQSLLLRTDSNPSLHFAARLFTGPSDWAAWGELGKAMQGATPFRELWGAERFEYMKTHPDEARLFDAVMANQPDDRLGAIAAAYDFSGASLIVDIGGGNGALLRAILTRYPGPRGLVFDRDDVVGAISIDDRCGDRIQVESGDFFERTPPAADLYLLSWILHDWSDDQCLRILRNCRRAMRTGTRLLVVERVLELDPTEGNTVDYLSDMNMMVVNGGRERTIPEFQRLLTATGFGPARPFPTTSPVWIIETAATKIL